MCDTILKGKQLMDVHRSPLLNFTERLVDHYSVWGVGPSAWQRSCNLITNSGISTEKNCTSSLFHFFKFNANLSANRQ